MHFSQLSTFKLVNRVDKLQLCEVDEKLLLRYGKHNKLMNAYVLRIDKVTLQVFLLTRKAMCFSHSVDVVTALLPYGNRIKESTLCTSTWVAKLDVHQLNLYQVFSFLVKHYNTFYMYYEPELFHCITVKHNKITLRIFHSGKVVLLGVKCVCELVESWKFICNAIEKYTLI